MAEVLATMVVGPLVSMVKEKASSILLEQYKVMEGMEDQHKLLKRKLPAVLDVITDAEEQAAKNREGAKAWLQELREVAYKANDLLDEFKYEALRRKAKAEGHYKEFGMDVIKLFPSHNQIVFRYRMANKLRMILQEIDVLITEMNIFRFKFKPPQPPMSLKWRQTDSNIPDHSLNIVNESRDEEKKEIIDTLLDQGDNVGLIVLPIVGMGGMGKTTLAQLVYNDSAIQKHFQVRLWVCVSENFDVDSLSERIVEAAKANGCKVNGTTTLENLKSVVSGNRYLLVLDDVWNREAYKWEKLRSYLHHGGRGSSVLTTTRDKNIAQFMGTIRAHEIKGLDLDIIKEIIKTGAFGSQAEVPTEFKKLVSDVADRCKGSPLAATALGSVLRTKNTVQEWEAILSRNTICDEESGILPILKLSYNCLPPYMRQCFAFCAMFPKDHEIDVEMLIRLWMANSFIPEQKGVCPEVTGKQIFNELAQRSFFQEVKQDKFYTQITCKIHDLMVDVAQDSMGKECATIDTKLCQSEDFLYSARHLFLSVDIPGNVLNAFRDKGSLSVHTLICDGFRIPYLQKLSKYCRSVRALKTQALYTKQGSFLEAKYLHHLRYLDISGSLIDALPEHITIMYNLQTLNLSDCGNLEQLPKAMKYMTALRHLYINGCRSLKCMPPNLGQLTSLQTLTCFVLGTGSGCSNMGELNHLDLGGQLELKWLHNVRGEEAKSANLWDKKRLQELTLRWSGCSENDEEVLEALRPHDGLKAMRIYNYGSIGIPTSMLELQGMVELELQDCNNLENLPALWQLPALQSLRLNLLKNLNCLFSGGAPSKFPKLKMMMLAQMPKFEKWWDTNEVQGEEPLFPEVESLSITRCGSLTALPKASVVKQSSSKHDTVCRSAFPALREMWLTFLEKFHRWEEAVDGTQRGCVTFPQLEKLHVFRCSKRLTTFPEVPMLRDLSLEGCSQQLSLCVASRNITSLFRLYLEPSHNSDYNVAMRKHESPSQLRYLSLTRCSIFFSDSSALALWKCFGQVVSLEIVGCDALVYWPEKVLHGLVSLRRLVIGRCRNLTGHMKGEASDEQSAILQRSGTLPRLESLEISYCASLMQVPNLSSSSLKSLHISGCRSLKSIVFCQQQDDTRRLVSAGVVQLADTSSTLIAAGSSCSSEEATVSTALVLKPVLSSSASSSNCCFFPCLESLDIYSCNDLTEVVNLPRSIKTLKIWFCSSLVTVSEEVPSLEQLDIFCCQRLKSLLNGHHQAYSTLRVLSIRDCHSMKQLPLSLQHLNHLEKKHLDHHLQGPAEPVPTRQNTSLSLMSKLACVIYECCNRDSANGWLFLRQQHPF